MLLHWVAAASGVPAVVASVPSPQHLLLVTRPAEGRGGRGEWSGTKGCRGWRGELWRACAVCGPYVSKRRAKGRGASAVATWLVHMSPMPNPPACCADAMLGSVIYSCIPCARFGCQTKRTVRSVSEPGE
eukprot:7292729-Prymnesium_polylepis.1